MMSLNEALATLGGLTVIPAIILFIVGGVRLADKSGSMRANRFMIGIAITLSACAFALLVAAVVTAYLLPNYHPTRV